MSILPWGLESSASGSQTMERSHGCWHCPAGCSLSPISASGSPRHSTCGPNEQRGTGVLGDVSTLAFTPTAGGRQPNVSRMPCPQLMITRREAKRDHVRPKRCRAAALLRGSASGSHGRQMEERSRPLWLQGPSIVRSRARHIGGRADADAFSWHIPMGRSPRRGRVAAR